MCNFSKKSKPTNRLTGLQEIQIYFELVCQNPRNGSKKFEKDISSGTGDIPIFVYFSKEVSQLTDWQTYTKCIIIWKKCTSILGMSPKKIREISHPELEISLHLSNFSKELSQLRDIQEIQNYLKIV